MITPAQTKFCDDDNNANENFVMTTIAQQNPILADLTAEIYLIGSDIPENYDRDWSEVAPFPPEVLLRPRTAEEIAQILRLCQKHNQPIVVQGGRTGISGGAVAKPGEWALSLERLDKIKELDKASMTITVEAGVILENIHKEAAKEGLIFPIDFGSRGSCMAGGIAATNAGGIQVIRYGVTRNLVTGLQAVLPDGTILSAPNKLLKNNAGFDLKHLFIGAEGTLGIITELTFRLFPQTSFTGTALCGLTDFDKVIELLAFAQKYLTGLSSFEVMWAGYMDMALELIQKPNPFQNPHPFYVLLEVETTERDKAGFEPALMQAYEQGFLADILIAQNLDNRADFWRIREAIADMMHAFSPAANFDIGIPISRMKWFTEQAETVLTEHFAGCRIYIFGHIGDGNLHMLVSTGRHEDVEVIERLIFGLTREAGGTITAEHGIGVLKTPWLNMTRSVEEIDLMRQLKQMMDPKGILNPNRIVATETAEMTDATATAETAETAKLPQQPKQN